MIFTLLFGILKLAVSAITALLPSWSPLDLSGATSAITAQGGTLFGMVAWADQYVPARLLLALVVSYFAIYVASFTVRFFSWLLTKLHIAGGS